MSAAASHVTGMTPKQLARLIDHTQLKPYATEADHQAMCEAAVQYGFAAVTINPVWANYCARQLSGSDVRIDACIGFPLGANTAAVKVEEAKDAVRNGAREIDMVINMGALKSGYPNYVEREISAVVDAVKPYTVKVILEAGYLTEDEKVAVCEMAARSGAAYIKTSTGYGNRGISVEDVVLIRNTVGKKMGIKAAGGIRTLAQVLEVLDAGATRIGTSASVSIVRSAAGQG